MICVEDEFMQKAKFLKVSQQQYENARNTNNCIDEYNQITLPVRATVCSAGYDFFAPFDIVLESGQTLTVPTGIRCLMPDSWVLLIFPRSGLGFKYRLRLDNTVGVIDADYSNSDNEGHIFIRITNEGKKSMCVEKGKAFAQGVFVTYGTTEDDNVTQTRQGGLGSTDKK